MLPEVGAPYEDGMLDTDLGTQTPVFMLTVTVP